MRVYVGVDVYVDEAGGVHPLCIHWEDGRTFQIQSVTDVRKAASLKAGGAGVRYTCFINNQTTFLFYEEPRWFVDAKNGVGNM